MTEIGVLMLRPGPRIAADLERWGITRTVHVPRGALVDELVAERVKGESATIFAAPHRRWLDVMDAVRAACRVVAGGVTLRFYDPDCVIDVRSPFDQAQTRWGICPLFDPREAHGDAAACARVKRALKNGIADLIADEMRAMRADAMAAHARIAHLLPRAA